MNKLPIPVGLAIAAGSMLPMAFDAQPAHAADAQRICVDAQGGPIDASDPINTIEIQRAVGAAPDGVFGKQTCAKTWQALIQIGHISGNGTSLKIGPKVHEWLNVPVPTADNPHPLPPSDNESDIVECPVPVTSRGEITPVCAEEAKQRLRNMGFVDDSITRAVKAFQIEAGVTTKGGAGYGTLGPKTYNAIMSGSGIQTINASPELRNGFVVDISDQTMKYYKNGQLVVSALVSTGAPENETRLGSKQIYRTRTDEDGWVRSSLQDASAEPAMYKPYYFDGGQAFHGTRRLEKLGSKASKGCVRLAPSVIDVLIQKGLLREGAKVSIQE